MRFSINLATQPYENLSSFLLRWGLALVLALAGTAALVAYAVKGWQGTRDISVAISRDQGEIAQIDQQIAGARAVLARPENQNVTMQSGFLNSLIARKSFSWTEAFTTLEKLMPSRCHVIAIQPELDEENRLELKLTVGGDNHNNILELLRRMEASDHFQQPQLTSETNERDGKLQAQIDTLYLSKLPGANHPENPAKSMASAAPRSEGD